MNLYKNPGYLEQCVNICYISVQTPLPHLGDLGVEIWPLLSCLTSSKTIKNEECSFWLCRVRINTQLHPVRIRTLNLMPLVKGVSHYLQLRTLALQQLFWIGCYCMKNFCPSPIYPHFPFPVKMRSITMFIIFLI